MMVGVGRSGRSSIQDQELRGIVHGMDVTTPLSGRPAYIKAGRLMIRSRRQLLHVIDNDPFSVNPTAAILSGPDQMAVLTEQPSGSASVALRLSGWNVLRIDYSMHLPRTGQMLGMIDREVVPPVDPEQSKQVEPIFVVYDARVGRVHVRHDN